MAISFESALNAYNAASRRFVAGEDSNQQSLQGLGEQSAGAPTFGDMVKDAAESAASTMREGERLSAAAVNGKADLTDVVMAVNNAEVMLQSVVAIRDKVISAYQEILRMPM
jgi:flagellar hook-basal body complex protein FliE